MKNFFGLKFGGYPCRGCYAAMPNSKRKFGFTLAEVLITLGIIGVVAALTMPMLISEYQKQVTVTQLKKSYSVWSQAFQNILADEGVEKLSDTELFGKINGGCAAGVGTSDISGCNDFFESLQKYISVEKPGPLDYEYGGISYSNGEYIEGLRSYISFDVKGSSRVFGFQFSKQESAKTAADCEKIKSLGGEMCDYLGKLAFDVNGKKGPTTGGLDIFSFYFDSKGRLFPYGGKDYALFSQQEPLESNKYYWKYADSSQWSCNIQRSPNPVRYLGCTARIMEDGWKINY